MSLLSATQQLIEWIRAIFSLTPAQQLVKWIEACNKLHGEECQAAPMSTRSKDQIPQWVIDTDQACIVPGSTVPRYAALSYVWPAQGGSSDRLILERSNIEGLQKPGALAVGLISQLPLVIRQTIELLKEIGERYLWVDCLCIVQHDSETQSQAYSMNEIYSGAYFTIIAAASDGLLGTYKSAEMQQNRFRSDIVTAESHYGILMGSKWATRGWTFQEQILSKRAIIFLNPYSVRPRRWLGPRRWYHFYRTQWPGTQVKKHLFWDCQCAVWDGNKLHPKTDSIPLEMQPLSSGQDQEETNTTSLKLNDTAWPKFRSYLEAVCLYNNRNLTYPQDVLVAFSGVLNELGYSFPGGFVQGLPQCFIDESLIWQPFSKAIRRGNAVKDGVAPSRYLPSWSWCSWRCPIDPYSLATGLEYSADPDPRLPRSWRTKPLVEWSIVSADLSQEILLKEAGMQYRCKQLASSGTPWDVDRWTKHCQPTSDGGDSVYFTHTSSGSQRTCFPLPVGGGSRSLPDQLDIPYLSCTTRRARFTVHDYLHCYELDGTLGGVKASVFDLPQFKDSPGHENACSVIALEDGVGEWVGVLRVMDGEDIYPGREVEVIAISSGEASYADVVQSFEERVDFLHIFEYRTGRECLIWKPVNSKEIQESRNGVEELKYQISLLSPASKMVDRYEAQSRPPDLVDAFNKSQSSRGRAPKEGTYHFYNVMWIEWKGCIAYRRAVGRIRKEAWEKYCSEPIQIVLG